MKKFWIRTVNLILIVGLLLGYNQVTLYRQKAEEVNSLKTQLTDSKNMLKNAENKMVSMEKSNENSGDGKAGNKAVNAADNTGIDNGNLDDNESAGDLAQTSQYKDGKYQGQANGYGGAISVEVTVAQGEISQIQILLADKEDKAYFDMATKIVDSIKENQSTDVDTVSGATFSSTGILNAVKQALEKAK